MTACYPDAIKPGEDGILQPRVSPDRARSHVQIAISAWHGGTFNQFSQELLEGLYRFIFDMTQAEYAKRFASR